MAGDPEEDVAHWKSVRRDWTTNLETFARDIYPAFQPFGFTLPDAWAAYHLRRIYVDLTPESPDEPWRQ